MWNTASRQLPGWPCHHGMWRACQSTQANYCTMRAPPIRAGQGVGCWCWEEDKGRQAGMGWWVSLLFCQQPERGGGSQFLEAKGEMWKEETSEEEGSSHCRKKSILSLDWQMQRAPPHHCWSSQAAEKRNEGKHRGSKRKEKEVKLFDALTWSEALAVGNPHQWWILMMANYPLTRNWEAPYSWSVGITNLRSI